MAPQVGTPSERRRARRVRPGPLRVRLFRSEGTLIDISETGALVRLPRREAVALRPITLTVEWHENTVLLRVRVVRSTSHRIELPTAVLTRAEHHVAIEFVDLASPAAATLRRLIDRTGDSAAGQNANQ